MVENVGPGSQACPSCGLTYVSWGHHVRYHGCKPPVAGVCAPCDESPSADEQPSMWDAEPRWREMASELGEKLAVMHLHSKVHISECRLAVELAEQAVSHVINACRAVVSSDESAAAAIDGVRVQESATLKQLRDIDAVCAKQATGALVPVPRPLLSPPEASKKQFALFSVEHLLRDEVQNDAETRWHVKSSTEEWKTGKFRQPPTVITDVVHGARFRSSPASRAAGPNEARRGRIYIQTWNDAATVWSLPRALLPQRACGKALPYVANSRALPCARIGRHARCMRAHTA